MKFILSKRLCQKHLIPVEQINQLRIGDLFIRKHSKRKKLSDCNIYILAAVGFNKYVLVNVNWGTRLTEPVECTLSNRARYELAFIFNALGITSETYKIRE